MRLNTRQITLTLALIAPIVWTVVTTPPFVAQPAARAVGGGMFGPLSSAMAGGVNFYPTLVSGSTYKMNSPWDCNKADANDEVTFGGGTPYTTASRTNGARTQELRITRTTGGYPTGFSYADNGRGTGIGNLLDANSDGVYDQLTGSGVRGGTGAAVNFTFDIQFLDNDSDGNPDHVSVPWSEVNALGWLKPSDGCNDSEPRAWVPLADTNSDGKPDSIVLDLDGNGVADPQFYASAPLVPAAVPATNWAGLTLLGLLLASLAIWSLTRRETTRPA